LARPLHNKVKGKYMNGDKFWKSIERFKLFIELVTAIFVAIPIIYLFLANGLAARMPVWAVLLISLFAIFLGYLLGRNSTKGTTSLSKSKDNSSHVLLHTIDFDYREHPLDHNWTISSDEGNQPTVTHVSDGFFGHTIKIRASTPYAMDYQVEPIAQLGKSIEIVVKVEKGYGLYSLASFLSKDGSTRQDIWFNYQVGVGEPRPFSRDKSEWIVYVEPELMEGKWYKFSIDLQNVIDRSIGKEGWSFRKIRSFRVRGNVQIAYIKVYK